MEGMELALLEELYRGVERQGPGDDALTRTALHFVGPMSPEARIADIGCGTGAQTMVLASELAGRIVAFDMLPGFLEVLAGKIQRAGLEDQVKTLQGTMERLPFKDEELDLIWSEGAIYNIGFGRGINEWSRLLKPGGCLAVTEISWFTSVRPKAVEDYWNEQYSEMDTVAGKIKRIESSGLIPVAHFMLPSYCWRENYYLPLSIAEEAFLKKHKDNPLAVKLVDESRRERAFYDAYGEYYGYVFYVMRKGVGSMDERGPQ
ncbi:MAG: class I SAM-dependent methyltransferase [Treponemataceae bacterium]